MSLFEHPELCGPAAKALRERGMTPTDRIMPAVFGAASALVADVPVHARALEWARDGRPFPEDAERIAWEALKERGITPNNRISRAVAEAAVCHACGLEPPADNRPAL